MKWTTLLLVLCAGCAYMRSSTTRITDPKTGVITETTTARAFAFFDSSAQLTKFANRSGYTTNGTYAPGTYATGVNESATSTNLATIMGAVAEGVVKGMKSTP